MSTQQMIVPTGINAIQCASGTIYTPNVVTGLITVTNGSDVQDCIKAGCQAVGTSGSANIFGGGGLLMKEEGVLYKNIGNPIAGNAADTTDDVIGGFQVAASSFDIAGRELEIIVRGQTGANTNNKQVKLWLNPTLVGATVNADGSISGGTVSAAGTGSLLLASGVITLNALGFELRGFLSKYGASGSNTQLFEGGTKLGTVDGGIIAPIALTQAENAVMNIVITGASGTTGAANDIKLTKLILNATN